jgi:hypothetical protein
MATATTMKLGRRPENQLNLPRVRTILYFLFIGGSSTHVGQNPLGFLLVAFLTIVIFILLLLCSAGREVRQRNDCRFEAALVTRRQVHVAKLGMGGRDASARTDRDERAVAARLPWSEPVELLARGVPPRLTPVVDVAGRERQLPGEPGTGIQRAVGSDGVGVLLVHVARPVVHAVVGREAQAPRFLPQERQLVVEHVARVARRPGA